MHSTTRILDIVLTGIDSVLSVKGKKVLHIDRNDHYGGYGHGNIRHIP